MGNKNRFLSIAISALFISALVAGGYFLLVQKPNTQTKSEFQSPVGLTKVTNDSVISAVANHDGSTVWYFNNKGQLYYQTLGTDSKLDEYPLPSLLSNFKKAYWPTDGGNIILASNGSSGEQYNLLDSKTNQYKALPSNVKSLDWMPDGQRLVYVWQTSDKKSQQLILANADTSGFIPISDLFWADMAVKASPDGKNVLLWRSPAQDLNKIYMVNIVTGEFTTVVDQGKNLEAEWVSANKFIYNQIVEGKTQLKIFDLNTRKSLDLGLSASLDNVVSTGDYAYADVKDESGKDVVYKINLDTAEKQKVYTFESTVQPRALILNGQKLFFTNNLDGKLYLLRCNFLFRK